ncbi:hypothetical protein D3C87_86710 [compost metagenome]
MESLNKIIPLTLVVLFISACGVKGRPLPPTTPPPLGRGEPTKSPEVKKIEASKNRYNIKDEQDAGEE